MTQYTFQQYANIGPTAYNADVHNTHRLYKAARYGEVDQIPDLIALVPSLIHRNCALEYAAGLGQADFIQAMLAYMGPKLPSSSALEIAASGGFVECVKLLADVCDPSDYYDVLFAAVRRNQVECVKFLAPFTPPRANSSHILTWAATCLPDLVDLLLDVDDVDDAIKSLQTEGEVEAIALLEEHRNQRQNQMLRTHVGTQGIPSKRHKI